VTLVPLDPFYNVRFEDGSVFHYNGDRDYLLEQIRQFNPADVEGYHRFYRASEQVFQKGLPLMTKPFSHFTDMLKGRSRYAAIAVLQISSRLCKSVHPG
jgi:phytoene desaturase